MQDPIYVKKIQEADAALASKLESDASLTVSRDKKDLDREDADGRRTRHQA